MRIRKVGAAVVVGALLITGCSSDSDDTDTAADESTESETVQSDDTDTAADEPTESEAVVGELAEGEVGILTTGGWGALITIPVDLGAGQVETFECEIEMAQPGIEPSGDEVDLTSLAVGTPVELTQTGSGEWECLFEQ